MSTDSQLESIRTVIELNRDGALLVDEHGRIVTHNTALVELLGQPAGTRFDTALRLGPVNLQRLLVRAAIAAGEQDAVGRPTPMRLDFQAVLDVGRPALPVRVVSVPLADGARRLRVVVIRPDLPPADIPPDVLGFSPGSPLESEDAWCRAQIELARSAVAAGVRLLVLGETGTGKTALAQALWRCGPRASASLVEIHCASVPETVLQSELFGHVRGAFPGASAERVGRIEQADGGTLLLDEIGAMSESLGNALLRVLDDGRFERMGENRTRYADIRVISTSGGDPGGLGAALYHRLAGLTIVLPPLRERPVDLDRTIERWCRRADVELTGPARAQLRSHQWPGNFRELRNVLAVLELHPERGRRLDEDAVGAALGNRCTGSTPLDATAGPRPGTAPAPFTAAEEREREALRKALAAHNGNRSQAARSLGIDRTTLWRKLHRLRLIPERESS